MQKVILSIVGLVIGIMLVANLLPDVIDEAATDPYSENFAVDTAPGVTTATVTLSYGHYYGDNRHMTVSSDNTSDSPIILAAGYNPDTNVVEVANLHPDDDRTLTINYVREAHLQYTGFSAFLRLIPFLAIIGLVIAALWGLFSHMKRD